MTFIQVNGANLFYETFGVDIPGRTPVLLIHGSTGTGRSNWSQVAPLLARDYYVIVPDCRGHGQSSNPNHSYNFKEMAADMAALIRLLGYERAHIIGHSNGGNVALVTLLEHPEVVQTAIPQAANAWVSPDLPAVEPAKFDPDRVAREVPEWMNEMIRLHGPTHGVNYWRELLKMTVDELTTQPNYTIQDLNAVKRPSLLIQGASDLVNAGYKHAEFIALNIPDAEMWIPKDTGHNVHVERLFQWVEKVLDFLERRGTDAGDALYRMSRHAYPDKRVTVFDLHAKTTYHDRTPLVNLTGRVLNSEQLSTAVKAIPAQVDASQVKVLMDEDTPWALVKRGVNDLRRGPDIFTERISQVLFGEVVQILEAGERWAYVRLDHDGYLGWMQIAALQRCTKAEAQNYQADCNGLVCAEQAVLYPGLPLGGEITGRLPFGVSVLTREQVDGAMRLELPGGESAWTNAMCILPIAQRPKPDAAGASQVLSTVRSFCGIPYLWGGRTPFGFDCSGFAQACMRFLGLSVPRDADQQFYAGKPIEGDPQPGDLLFFGDWTEPVPNMGVPEPGFTITHVAVSLGGQEYIHSNGAAWAISINSFDPRSPLYRADLKREWVGTCRFLP